MRILVVEDEAEVAAYLAKGLKEHGYAVDLAHDGKEGLYMALSEPFDAMIIDRMLPNVDGLSIVRSIRQSGSTTPVLILSALGQVDDRVDGLREGSDDYLIKPFSFSELIARLDALQRRSTPSGEQTKLTVGDLEMDLLARSVRRSGREIDLKPREFALLEYLMRNTGRVITRTMLLEHVWDYHFDPQTNVIDVHISRLRQKLDRGFDVELLQTVRGAGYTLRAPDQTPT
ncbi:MAG: response regulator transcription factor [Halofilum sp. (in: g-proteobacteria)]